MSSKRSVPCSLLAKPSTFCSSIVLSSSICMIAFLISVGEMSCDLNFSLVLCVSLNSSCRSLSCWYTSDISSSANMCSGISMFMRNLAR